MPITVISFPDRNPVLVTTGRFAIRCYALASIFGIVLGWVYRRPIIRDQRKGGGPAPLKVAFSALYAVMRSFCEFFREPIGDLDSDGAT